MAYSTISKPSLYFNTKLYTGNATTNHAQTGIGFQPDWLWIKERGGTGSHILVDAVRGVSSSSAPFIKTNSNGAEVSSNTSDFIKSLDSDGFTLGADSYFTDVNKNSSTYAAWNWKAGTGQGSSNTDGSINTTYTSVNTTAGFSISQYVGNATSGATVGHGLGTTPGLIFVKKTSASDGWGVYHHKNTSAPATEYLRLDSTAATSDNLGEWNDTAPTSTVFTIGNSGRTNDNGVTYIAYCFAEKKGYSKFGSYTGNGNADGTFIYCGFKPAWIIIKESSHAGNGWHIRDIKRSPINVVDDSLYANANNTETTNNSALNTDFLSNGFKLRNTDTNDNASGRTYIFMAFAEEPLVANVGAGIPATAV